MATKEYLDKMENLTNAPQKAEKIAGGDTRKNKKKEKRI